MFFEISNIPSYSVVRSANAAFAPSYHPVAVFLGRTSGIGQGMAQVFASITQGNADIIIVGRNQTAAEKFFASLPQPSGDKTNTRKPAREFVECDATVMKNVHTACQEILSRHSKINYLVMSPGFMALSGRDESSEGIDKKLAVHYYSRSRMFNDLLPALKNAKDAGEDAKVMSSYSSRNPSLSFIHAYPGFVRTNIMASSSSTLLSFSSSLLLGLTYPLSVSAEDCGEHMWYAMLNAKEGVHRTGSKGEDLEKTRYFGNEEQSSKLWDHTQEATKVE
ncbi:hypothetical protein B0H34DRAFT_785765 [Crassisporium funariophilum]|nr:hypothetical protein B0H34DRAFT_785765 [Crassisporium funariophilum]